MKQIQEMKATNKVTQVKAGYLFAQSAKLSDQLEAVEAVFTSLASRHSLSRPRIQMLILR